MSKKSTFDRYIKNPEFQKEFDREYKELILSELIHQLMDETNKSVREFALDLGVSKTIIQNIRSGKQLDIKLSNFINMAQSCGYRVVLEKDDSRISLPT